MKDVFEKFVFINYLDFVQNQSFPNKKAEAAFKELFYRVVGSSGIFEECEEFIRQNLESEKTQIKEQIPLEIQSMPNKKLAGAIRRHLFGNKIDYTLLLHFEILHLCRILKVPVRLETSGFWSCFDHSDRQKKKVWHQINDLHEISSRKIRGSFNEITQFMDSQKKYEKQKVFNIAVCATMSAGKSTFVNALLGNDYLPARNEATTAKITSVYDNDAQKKMIGFATDGEKILDISDNLNVSDIDRWNADNGTRRIYLQADLDSICSEKVICAVHDTPGTNNSANSDHMKITMDFLKNGDVDMIVFVANATQLETEDELSLLKNVFKEFSQNGKTNTLFILNKSDCIDCEMENPKEIIKSYKEFLQKIGFENPRIFTVAAKSARLFKMAIKGKSERFTENEIDDFESMFRKFTKRIDLQNEDFKIKSEDEDFSSSQSVNIEGREYKIDSLSRALKHSGIVQIEKFIESLL